MGVTATVVVRDVNLFAIRVGDEFVNEIGALTFSIGDDVQVTEIDGVTEARIHHVDVFLPCAHEILFGSFSCWIHPFDEYGHRKECLNGCQVVKETLHRTMAFTSTVQRISGCIDEGAQFPQTLKIPVVSLVVG